MIQAFIIALGAGLASGVLFVIPTKGTLIATLLAVVSPLPLMIAGLGFGLPAGLAAVAAGGAAVAFLLHPLFGLAWLALVGGPSWLLAILALKQPAGRVVTAMAAISAALALGFMALSAARFGSFEAAAQVAAGRLEPALQQMLADSLPASVSPHDLAYVVVLAMPAMMAGWGVLTFALNLWVAARVVAISDLLPAPAADLADTLRLPRLAALVLAVALGACFLSGAPGLAAAAIAAALGAAFALQGLGALHSLTRGMASRRLIISMSYAVILALMPWPLLLAAGLGLVDCLMKLPRKPVAIPAPKIKI